MEEEPSEWADRKVGEARGIYQSHGTVFRSMWIAVGFIVVAAGLAMIVFPGPVTIVVPLGLVMLAAVFGWARRLLLRSVEEGAEATRRFRQASTPVKALTFAASACVAAAIVAWIVL
jgi:uncharacterized protein (TIGR02611 family)